MSMSLLLKNVKCSVAAEHSLRHINFDIILNIIKYYSSLTSRKIVRSVSGCSRVGLPSTGSLTSLLRRQLSVPKPRFVLWCCVIVLSSSARTALQQATALHLWQSLGRYLTSSDQYKMRRNMGKRLHTGLVGLSSATGTTAINIETHVTIF